MKQAYVVVGLGFGDEGKGSIVDYLARVTGATACIRYNGGPQAAHNVVTDEDLHHCFAQFGSSMLLPRQETYLARGMLVNPFNLQNEADALSDKGIMTPADRLVVHEDCPVITPFHVVINRMEETIRNSGRHGSCGQGVGRTVMDVERLGKDMVYVRDFRRKNKLREKLRFLYHEKLDLAQQWASQHKGNVAAPDLYWQLKNAYCVEALVESYVDFYLNDGIRVVDTQSMMYLLRDHEAGIFEGAQGVLLDADYGFWPHVTPTTTTTANALSFLQRYGRVDSTVTVGVLRAYATRHGVGPFPTEDQSLVSVLPELHNGMNEWQREFRVGWFDTVMARYALAVNGGVDYLALTHVDQIARLPFVKLCYAYEYRGLMTEEIEDLFICLPESPYPIITDIRVPVTKPSRERQKRVAEILLSCRPLYQECLAQECIDMYVSLLEDLLQVPVGIVSRGPKPSQKEWRIEYHGNETAYLQARFGARYQISASDGTGCNQARNRQRGSGSAKNIHAPVPRRTASAGRASDC